MADVQINDLSPAAAIIGDENIELGTGERATAAQIAGNMVTALSSTSGVVSVDCSLGNYFTLTPAEAITGWTFVNVPEACSITIKLLQGATAYAVSMPVALWGGGTVGTFSTTANARDRLAMTTDDGGTTWDAALGKAFA